MARIIGIDYGKRRVGLAVTDPLHLIATPLKTLNTADVLCFLQTYIEKEPVEAIVVGMPLHLSGERCAMTRLVNRFIRMLKRYFPQICIFDWDERFTSVMAQASRIEGGFRKKVRQDKAALDAISATFILRSFLVYYKKLPSKE